MEPVHVAVEDLGLTWRDVVITGGQVGIDSIASGWAEAIGIHTASVTPLMQYGPKRKFHIRNHVIRVTMAPTEVLAFSWGDEENAINAPGTASMLKWARASGLPLRVVEHEYPEFLREVRSVRTRRLA